MATQTYEIDELDRIILSSLIKDARKPFLEIARECGVSGAAIHQRVKKLEDAGIITGSSLIVKPSAIGLTMCAFINISLTENNKYPNVVESLKKIPEVVECHFTTGSAAILVKLYCTDQEHLMEIILNTIQNIPGIKDTNTMISLDTAFERSVWVKEFANKITWRKSGKQ